MATICLCFLSITNLSAAPVDSSRAKQQALDFFSSLTKTFSNQLLKEGVSIAYCAYTENAINKQTDKVCFYVVNVGRRGFVMLSGDDRIKPILGYSYESSFNTKDMPESVRGWLGERRKEISYALTLEDFSATPEITEQWSHLSEVGASLSVVVPPLLQTEWNQGSYYNLYCPIDVNGPNGHVYAGCEATAMAQVIRYWEWPIKGVGAHSYVSNYTNYGNYGLQSADFESTTYDYRLMPAYITSSTPLDQIDAVATLLYHCGVSINMSYGANESSAYHSTVAVALRNYFSYSTDLSYVQKNNYSDNNWKTMIKNELQNNRPIIYEGFGNGAGHAFVLDGYDDNNLFHINWGWGGSYDGFFSLSSLNPSSHNFTNDQGAIIGVQPSVRCTMSISDYDSNVYNTIKLGNQCWMKENLRTTHYSDGTDIAFGSSASSSTALRYSPNNNVANVPTYGYLYNWAAVMKGENSSNANPSGVQGVCPSGWHVPSDAEWTQLTDYVGGKSNYVCGSDNTTYIAKALASTLGWIPITSSGVGPAIWASCTVGQNPSSNNATGFSVMPAGGYTNGNVGGFDTVANIWSSTESGTATAYNINLNRTGKVVNHYNTYSKSSGYSVRCLQNDNTNATLPTLMTSNIGFVTDSSAVFGGNIISDGGSDVLAYGVCWGTSHVPKVDGNHTNLGSGIGAFSNNITGLTPNTTYYVRAYATTSVGTAYGNEVSFRTTVQVIPDEHSCPEIPTVTDIDGNAYNTVQIGQQCWMRENLRTIKYANGEMIVLGTDTSSTVAFRYYPGNNSSNVPIYGYLYNWSAVMHGAEASTTNPSGVQGICPTGWHVPSDTEWNLMEKTVSGSDWQTSYETTIGSRGTHAGKLAGGDGWTSNTYSPGSPGDYIYSERNSSGFSVVPAGCWGWNVSYVGYRAYFWSSSENNDNKAWRRNMSYDGCSVSRNRESKYCGFSVRCLHNTISTSYVITDTVTAITATSATCGGNVTSDGGATVTARGVCWSTSQNPTVSDSYTCDGSGTGSFTSSITGLAAGTTYYVRAYATNSEGTSYGIQVSFTTLSITAGDAQPCPETPTVTDHEGNVYNTVKIGNQCWTRENIRTTTSPSTGTYLIPPDSVGITTSGKQARWYNNDSVTYAPMRYGLLYNWNAAVDTFDMAFGETSVNQGTGVSVNFTGYRRGICPEGWHVPSDAEWNQLTDYVSAQSEYQCDGNSTHIAKSLADTVGWYSYGSNCAVGNNQSVNNVTGFSAVPAGYWEESFFDEGSIAWFWSSSIGGYGRTLGYFDTGVSPFAASSEHSFSVRCLRDSNDGGETSATLPTVTTSSVSNITSTTATCGGDVTDDGGAEVIARGVCWSTSQNPTIEEVHTIDGVGTGSFTSSLTGLFPNTTYYVRAYATNEEGTAYGVQKTFTTDCDVDEDEFSVSACNNYIWNDTSYTESGDYDQTFTKTNGCDSVVTLHLTIRYSPDPPTLSVTPNTICTGSNGSITVTAPIGQYTYSLNGFDFQNEVSFTNLDADYYTITVMDEYGCTNSATTFVENLAGEYCAPQISFASNSQNNKPFHFCRNTENAWICASAESNGDCAETEYDYKWQADCYDTTYFGACIEIPTQEVHCCTYTVTVTSLATGCETVTPIVVYVDHLNSIEFLVNDEPFTDVPRVVYNCVNKDIKIGINPNGWEHAMWSNAYISVSDPTYDFTIGANTTTAGLMSSYFVDVIDTNGCLARGVINLVSKPVQVVTVDTTVCETDLPFVWNGVTFTEPRMQMVTLTDAAGCDSVVTLHLDVIPRPILSFTINGVPATTNEMNSFSECEELHIAIVSTQELDTASINWTSGITGTGFADCTIQGDTIANDVMTICVRATSKFGCLSQIYSLPISFVRHSCHSAPTVTTSPISSFNADSVLCGGVVTDDGGSAITACGVCWSTTGFPTFDCDHTVDALNESIFTSVITGIEPCANLYVCAYATNSYGTSYGTVQMLQRLDTTPPFIMDTLNPIPFRRLIPTRGSSCTYNAPDKAQFVNAVLSMIHDDYTDMTFDYLMNHAEFYWESTPDLAPNTQDIFAQRNHVTVDMVVEDECGNELSQLVIWMDKPDEIHVSTPSVTVSDTAICENGYVTLTYDSAQVKGDFYLGVAYPLTFEWICLEDDVTFSSSNDVVTTFAPNHTDTIYHFQMKVTDRYGCSTVSDPVSVSVKSKPKAKIVTNVYNDATEPYCPNYGSLTVMAVDSVTGEEIPNLTYSWYGESVNLNSVFDTTLLIIIPDSFNHQYEVFLTVTDTLTGCTTTTSRTIDVRDTLAPVFNGMLPDGHVCASEDGNYYVSDFTTYFTYETVSDNCGWPKWNSENWFPGWTVSQNPAAGTEIDTETEVTIILSDPCGNESLYFMKVVPVFSSDTAFWYSVCESELPIIWNGVTFMEAGTQTVTLTNAAGCDSVVTFNLTVLHPTDTVLTDTVIENDLPYVLNDHEYFYPGTYIQNTVNAFGCDSTIYLTLNIIGNISDTIGLTVCNSFEWNGITYTQSGDYTQYFSTIYGSDSVVALHLTVHYSDTTEFYQTSCYSYTWNDETYMETGNYTQILTDIYGCDSIVTLHLIIAYEVFGDTTGVACGSFDWYDYSNITESGIYTHTFEGGSSLGCDSTVVLHLTVHHSVTELVEVTACDSYTWNDSTYYVSGDYVKHFQTVYGCDSIVTLHLTVNRPTQYTVIVDTCDSFTWIDGSIYTESTDEPTVVLANAAGCDSVVTLNLTIRHSTDTVLTVSVNENDLPFVCGNSSFDAAGSYTDVIPNAAGCDSTFHLNLTINRNVVSSVDTVVCEIALPVVWNDSVFISAGTKMTIIPASTGADSTVEMTLTVMPTTYGVLDSTVCTAFLPLIWNGITFTEAGTQTVTLNNVYGCDSVVTMTLHVSSCEPPTVTTDTVYNITYAYATSPSTIAFGTVTDAGGSELTARGFCWSVDHNPTVNDSHTSCGAGTGTFSCNLTGLTSGTTYYVRAYATNSFGTAYGEEVSFTTCTNFTVSISGGTEIFLGQTACLTASGAEHFIWNTGDTTATLTVSPTVSTSYTVTGTDFVGCNKTASSMVYVRAMPTITPVEAGTGLSEIELFCGGQPVTLSANTVILTASDYLVASIPYAPPFSFTDGERLVENWDDNWTEASELTFPFVFYGNVYNQIVPGSNSVATFNADKANSFCAFAFSDTIPSTNLFSNTIFACYRDTYLRPNSSNNNDCVFAGVFGECPNRKYMLSFNNTHLFGSNYNIPGTFTTMIVLYEGTNVIDIYLQDTPNNSLTNNGNGVVGLQNNTGTKGIAPPGRNTGPWIAHEEAWRFIPVPITDYTVTWYLGTDTTVATGVVVGTGDTITVLPGESAYYTSRLQYTDNGESFDVANTCHVTVEGFESPISLIDSTVCAYDLPITWNGVIFTEAGTQTVTLTNVQGCDSIVSLHLTVNHSTDSIVVITACDSFTWIDGVTYYESTNSPTVTFTNADGCESVVTLHLTVIHSTDSVLSVTACDSFTWHGVTYFESTFTPTFDTLNAAGCDSTVTLHLTVHHSVTTEHDSTVCSSSLPMTWNGVTFTEAGTQTVTLQNVYGCDSVVVMHLTTLATPTVAVSATDTIMCDGGIVFLHAVASGYSSNVGYQWYKDNVLIEGATTSDYSTYESARDSAYHYAVLVTTDEGCGSLAYAPAVTFVYDPVVYVSLDHDIICEGGTAILTANVECGVPIEELDYSWYRYGLNASTELVGTSAVLITAGEESPGQYVYWLTVSSYERGCMSTSMLANYAVLANPAVTIAVANGYPTEVCDGGSTAIEANVSGGYGEITYQWYKNGDLMAGDTSQTLALQNLAYGVDDVYTVEVTQTGVGCANSASAALDTLVNVASSASNFSATVCDSYIWDGVAYYASGEYVRHFQTSHGCDSIVTLHLTVNHSVTELVEVTACDSYVWNDVTYTESGDYTNYQTTANGCDSIVTLHLTIHHGTHNVQSETLCESYTWHGATYTQSGTYTYDYTTLDGCPGTDTLKLTVNTPTSCTISDTVLVNSLPYTLNDIIYTSPGTYTQTLVNTAGCDSILTVNLTVLYNVFTLLDSTVCDVCEWNGITYTQSGDYTQQFTSAIGSDSVVTLHLTVNHSVTELLEVTACDSYVWNDVTYTESGDYPLYLTNAIGCDSIVTLHLTINHSDTVVFPATACNSYNWNGVTYTESGDYMMYMTNASGCALVLVLRLTVNHSDTTDLYATACDSYTWNDEIYTESGHYSVHLTNAAGCDSTVTLHLTVNHSVTELVEVTACDSYTWNGVTYTESGDYTNYLATADGCDSTVTLHLTINHSVTELVEATACDSYPWNGETYTESGVYTVNLNTASGCDSLVTLQLTIHYSDTIDFYATACGSYNWNGEMYVESGDYVNYMTNAAGCDLVTILHLTIYETEIYEFSVTTSDSCYTWNGITYCHTGDYTQTFQAVTGCDSVVTLHLIITVGIDNMDGFDFKVYPNPTGGVVNVQCKMNNGQEETMDIQVFDAYGRYLRTVPVIGEITQVNLVNYAAGIYFVKAVVGGQVVAVRKVVRE